jgi:hypothetical protein
MFAICKALKEMGYILLPGPEFNAGNLSELANSKQTDWVVILPPVKVDGTGGTIKNLRDEGFRLQKKNCW